MKRGTPAIVGLDFGMTNSVLTRYDPANNSLMSFKPTNHDTAILRSAITNPDKPLLERLKGYIALRFTGFRENFKIGLPNAGVTDSARRRNADYKAAKAFLESLFHDFFESTPFKELGEIVVTVPEAWISGLEQGGRDALLQIFRELNLPVPHLLSEPVAAACYFAHRHHKETGSYFDGHALVYDHGGGTLDISVVRLAGSHVEVVAGIGLSRDMSDKGFGGVAFDRQVLVRLIEREPKLKGMNAATRAKWLQEFESNKRGVAPVIESRCQSPQYHKLKGEFIFGVDVAGSATTILLADLIEVFEEHFAPTINARLSDVLRAAQAKQRIDLGNSERFRVVPVGGFSEFYRVQSLLSTFFNQHSGDPDVLKSHIDREDRSFAVSKGACLVAARAMSVNETCPFTFGLFSYEDRTRKSDNLIEAGEPQSAYKKPRMLDTEFGLLNLDAEGEASVVFYIERAGSQKPLAMKRRFSEALPDHGKAKTWRVGCSIEHCAVIVHFVSNTGRKKRFGMGKFLSMADGTPEEAVLD